MKVHVHYPSIGFSGNPYGEAVLEAMATGAARLGYDVERVSIPATTSVADVGILWGIGSRRFDRQTEGRNATIYRYREFGRPCVVVERGFVRREEYHSAGLGWIAGRADHRNEGSPPDRWDALRTLLGPTTIRRPYAGVDLVIGQVPHDTSCQHVDFEGWVAAKVGSLLAEGRRVVVRRHPNAPWLRVPEGVPVSDRADLRDDFRRARMVHTFSSTAGVDAMLAGVPVRADDANSMVSPDRTRNGYEAWARDIAYAQWTVDEMAAGLPLAHLLRDA